MSAQRKEIIRALLVAVSAGVVGCADCDFEVTQIERFLGAPVNQACSTDNDCVVEAIPNCLEVESSFCGQVTLNRQASQSKQWLGIQADAESCDNPTCSQCLAARIPKCTDGACSR